MGKYTINILPLVLTENQSNNFGHGNKANSTFPTTNPNIFVYYKPDNTLTDNGDWEVVDHGVNNYNPDTLHVGNEVGYQCSLMELLYAYKGVPCYFISSGRGGTFAYWDPTDLNFNILGENQTALGLPQVYDTITKGFWRPGITRMASKGIINYMGIVSFGGESDMNAAKAASYQVNEMNKLTHFRALPNLKNIKIVNISPNPLAAPYLTVYKTTVQTAKITNQANNPTWISNVDLITFTAAQFNGDLVHYNTLGLEIIGNAVFNLIKDN